MNAKQRPEPGMSALWGAALWDLPWRSGWGPLRACGLLACGLLACGALACHADTAVGASPPSGIEHSQPAGPAEAPRSADAEPPIPPPGAAAADARTARGPLAGSQAIAQLAVLISVDGLRPDAIHGHARTLHRLARAGASAVHARTISKSATLPSHASMVTGVDVDQHGLAFNAHRPEHGQVRYPTIFSRAHAAGLASAMFVGKRKLAHLLRADAPSTHFEVGGNHCQTVTERAVPYLERAAPGIVFVHFADTDRAGHRHGWMSPQYLAAVRRTDRCIRELLEALRRRGDMAATLVLVTSDHGGHGHHHATRKPVDRDTPWIAYGAGVKPRTRIGGTVYNIDTAATILHALGLRPPDGMRGRALRAAFGDGPEQAPR